MFEKISASGFCIAKVRAIFGTPAILIVQKGKCKNQSNYTHLYEKLSFPYYFVITILKIQPYLKRNYKINDYEQTTRFTLK